MKKVILIPLVASAALFGCQDQNQTQTQSSIEAQLQKPLWVGEYAGTTPCMGCLSHCDECPGMAVSLTLNEDQSYILVRESLSGHNEIETLTGMVKFRDAAKTQLELMNVTTRHLMFVDLEKQQLEIREDETGKRYQMQSDFTLGKQV